MFNLTATLIFFLIMMVILKFVMNKYRKMAYSEEEKQKYWEKMGKT
ncbi:MAG: hypothetical protein WC614_02365 [bacterium]